MTRRRRVSSVTAEGRDAQQRRANAARGRNSGAFIRRKRNARVVLRAPSRAVREVDLQVKRRDLGRRDKEAKQTNKRIDEQPNKRIDEH